MNAKELFILIDKIDPKFVEEAWNGGIESEEPVKVVLENNPSPFIRLAAAAAACVIMFGAGMFIGIKFFGGVSVLPSSRPENSSSDSESSYYESHGDTENSDSNTENSDSENTDSEPENSDNYDDKVILHDFHFVMSNGKASSSDYSVAEKQDNLDYALLVVEETNASDNNPIIAYICSISDGSRKILSETIAITKPGVYRIVYEGLRGAGAPCVLWMELPDNSDANDNHVICTGKWAA